MKRTIYLVVIALITCVCMMYGMYKNLTGHFHVNLSESDDTKIANEDTLESFDEIEIDMDLGEVKLVTGDTYSYSYEGDEKLKPEIRVVNDTLVVRHVGRISHVNQIKCNLTIMIPENTDLEDVVISIDAGNIDIDGYHAKNIDADVDAGNIDMSNCFTDDLVLKADAGEIDITDSTIGKGEVSVDAGNMDAENFVFDKINVNVDMGNIDMDLPLAYDDCAVDVEVDLGNVTINGDGYKRSFSKDGQNNANMLKAKCSMGNIDVNFKS